MTGLKLIVTYFGGAAAGAAWPLVFLHGPAWAAIMCLMIGTAAAVVGISWTFKN
jgi:hypothetical protein